MNVIKNFLKNIANTEQETRLAVHKSKMQYLEEFERDLDLGTPEALEEADDEEVEELRRLAPSFLGEGRRWVH